MSGFWAALGAVAITGLLNALVWPFVIRVTLPLTVLTLGLAALVLNGLAALAVAAIVPGVTLDGLGSAVVFVVCLTATMTLLSAALSIDDDRRFAAHWARQRRRRHVEIDPHAIPGVLFLEIDGLAHEILQRALRDGDAPALARWLHNGTHHLHRWETDLLVADRRVPGRHPARQPTTTSPAFRWWEKEQGRFVVTNHPRDAAELEQPDLRRAAASCTPTAPAAPTSSRAMRRTRC